MFLYQIVMNSTTTDEDHRQLIEILKTKTPDNILLSEGSFILTMTIFRHKLEGLHW